MIDTIEIKSKRIRIMKTVVVSAIIGILTVFAFGGCGDHKNHEEMQSGDSLTDGTRGESRTEYYTCPMHPSVVSDKPGSCPICGMTLVKKSGVPRASADDLAVARSVSLSPAQRVIANVATTVVGTQTLDREISAVGVVDYAEPLRAKVAARFRGRIEKLHVNFTGERVLKGQPLFELHSPDLYAAEQDFVLALKAMDLPGAETDPNRRAMLDAAGERLHLHFGLTHEQVEGIRQTRTAQDTITFYSPISGTVLGKEIQEGQYVDEGTVLYDLADLSRVWINLDVYEKDIRFVKMGHSVRIRAESYPGEDFSGRVTFIDPVLDSETRTVRVRTEFENSLGMLKPRMYVKARIHVPSSGALAVPSSAVMFTGRRNIVWVEVAENTFEPRDVRLGVASGPMVEVLEGLRAGDIVVTSGGYLIESESQLREPASGGGHKNHDVKTDRDGGDV